jgi:hypothetical protein
MITPLLMKTVRHIFVEHVPDQLEEGVLYISIPFETVIHKCCCGCGNEVVTPLSPATWSLIFDGETVSLKPSIGNWSFDCKSHYWIRKNRIEWSGDFTEAQIARVKQNDLKANQKYFDKETEPIQTIEPKKWYDWIIRIFN